MKWSKEAQETVEVIAQTAEEMTPPGFKEYVKARMGDIKDEARTRAEQKAKNRGAEEVSEQDIIEGLKEWIPPQYKGYLIKVLEQSGIDSKKYF